ncbi:UNVERIFIED_CONTAM: hypothetical protein GTU68_030957, partial [Idotea baltica]|nr:hypothetical protein [Idotea baltica]
EFLITRNHPNVKAGALLFSLFDVYEDIAFPGGIPFSWFTKEWGFANSELDHNRLPIRDLIPRLLVKGVAAVNGDIQSLEEALKEHEENVDLHAQASQVTFRDEIFDEATGETIEIFSPHTYLEQINGANIPLYCYSGWYDGAYCHSAIRRFANLTHPDSKLILGPWEHRGRFNISPNTPGKVGFDHLGELLKFFDCHLKGKETGIKSDAKVHYFTMGSNEWRASEQWPPKGAQMESWYFNHENTISNQKPDVKEGMDQYVANKQTGTGEKTRWRSMVSKLFTPKAYPDLATRDQQRLCYTSATLSENIEISGHPLIKLFVQSTAEDGSFHVYLEDVEPNGKIRYVTEGMLRALHRKVSNETPLYKDWVPYRTYKQADAQLLTPGEMSELYFDMLPVSYVFQKGHRIRVAFTCHDADHFFPVTPDKTVIQLHRNKEWASCCELPIVS